LVTEESILFSFRMWVCLKASTYATLTVIIMTVLFSSITVGFSSSSYVRTTFSKPASQGLQVWFDYPYFLEAGPCEYQLVVHAKTSNGFWITNLHWDFGDGSTLDVPFLWESLVSDSRIHGYASAGTYVVSVTASDSAGNTYTGYWGLFDAFPTSCIREPGPMAGNPTPTVSNAIAQSFNRFKSVRSHNLTMTHIASGEPLLFP
jgi:hypothetical protein